MGKAFLRTFTRKTDFLHFIQQIRKEQRPDSPGINLKPEVKRWGLLEQNTLCEQFFSMLSDCLGEAFTVVYEKNYVDISYRDTYYQYYSGQHFTGDRFSVRLSFFRENKLAVDSNLKSFQKLLDEIEGLSNNSLIWTAHINKYLGIDVSTAFNDSKEKIIDEKDVLVKVCNVGSYQEALLILTQMSERYAAKMTSFAQNWNESVIRIEGEGLQNREKNNLMQLAFEFYYLSQKLETIKNCLDDCYWSWVSALAVVSEEHWFDFETYQSSNRTKESGSYEQRDAFQEAYVGSCVLNPLLVGSIGFTLLDPDKLQFPQPQNGTRYVRRAVFSQEIFGRRFEVKAFPFRTQDGQFTRCTEVTLLNLFDYFGNRYPMYRTVLPSEINIFEKEHSSRRVLPAIGITYDTLSNVIRHFGFTPFGRSITNLYRGSNDENQKAVNQSANINTDFEKYVEGLDIEMLDEGMHRCLHHYIESGIPVAVGLKKSSDAINGHSLLCIGHSEMADRGLREKICEKYKKSNEPITFVDSASFFEQYVVMDDSQFCYSTASFLDLSNLKHRNQGQRDGIVELCVPLNRRMIIDEASVYTYCKECLADPGKGIGDKYKGKYVILRLFLTTCRSYKAYRTTTLYTSNSKNMVSAEKQKYLKELQKMYATLPMPRFVWVCELYDGLDNYEKLTAFGELVFDGTSLVKGNSMSSLIMAVYQNQYMCQNIEHEWSEIKYPADDIGFIIPAFRKNLQEVEMRP